MRIKKIRIIVNPRSGKGRPVPAAFSKVFAGAGIDCDISVTDKYGDAGRFAREALGAGADAVVVYGGDGTMTEVAACLIGSRLPLLPLRGGTGNVLASELDIPADIGQACGLLTGSNGKVHTIDAGKIIEQGKPANGRLFLLRVSLGFEAEMVKAARRDLKTKVGSMAYVVGAVKAYFGAHPVTYDLDLDGEKVRARGLTCIIANSGNIGVPGHYLAPGIRIDDGKLDVVLMRRKFMSAFSAVTSYVIVKKREGGFLCHWKAKEIRITARPAQTVVCDGEVLDQQGVAIRIIPGALKVIVPAGNPAEIQKFY